MNTQNTFSLLKTFTAVAKKSWLFLILLLNPSTIQAQGPTFTISPSVTTPVAQGTAVTFDVTVNDYTDILSTQFTISWNPSILDFVSIDAPNMTDFPNLSNANFGISTSSTGYFNISWLENTLTPVFIPDGTRMFSFTMITLTNGTSVVQIAPDEVQEIISGDFVNIGLLANNTSIEVIAEVAAPVLVPTMSEWGLFLFGLSMLNLGLLFIYKKQLLHL